MYKPRMLSLALVAIKDKIVVLGLGLEAQVLGPDLDVLRRS